MDLPRGIRMKTYLGRVETGIHWICLYILKPVARKHVDIVRFCKNTLHVYGFKLAEMHIDTWAKLGNQTTRLKLERTSWSVLNNNISRDVIKIFNHD